MLVYVWLLLFLPPLWTRDSVTLLTIISQHWDPAGSVVSPIGDAKSRAWGRGVVCQGTVDAQPSKVSIY